MIGIAPEDVPTFAFCPPLDPTVAEQRLRVAAYNWIWEWWGSERDGRDYFTWERWHDVPYDQLAKAFTRDELIRLWFESSWASRLGRHFEENEELVWKVQHSLWRYGVCRDYDRYLACTLGLRRLNIELPDFDLRITHTRSINTAAWSTHINSFDPKVGIYLDASFGLLVYYKGKHVLTIGFAFAERGILLAQVQLREKRGNRFLYKLSMPYLDFALDVLRRAFPDDPLWIVTGKSTADAVRRAYPKEERDKFKPEVAARIERFYDQELRHFTRSPEAISGPDDRRLFVRLVASEVAPPGAVAA